MCAMNQQRWSDVYEERLQDPMLVGEPQASGMATTNRPEPVPDPS